MIVLEQVDTSFDANHRPVVATHSSGAINAVVQTSYDTLGRTDCVAQRMNPATWTSLPASACTPQTAGTHGPDRIGRTIRNAAGETTEVRTAIGTALEATEATSTYTLNGRPLTLTDGMNNRTSYEYDGHDRLRRTYLPLAAQGSNASNAEDYVELGYDAAGNVVTRRNRAGEVASYTFDALNRTIAKNLPGSEPDVTYGYDLLGRMTSASQTGHALGFTYDALGRNLTQTSPQGTMTSAWDSAGRRIRLTWPDAFYVDYDYLVTGEMTKVRENGATSGIGLLAIYAYDYRGRRISLTRGNGAITSYSYDAASRLSALSHDFTGTANDVVSSFSYNPAGQIASRTVSNDAYAWTHSTAGTTDSTINGLNQLTVHGAAVPTYDARGNMTFDGTMTYGYSSENLLVASSGLGSALSYDPLMRFHQLGSSGDREVYDGGAIVAETHPTTNQIKYRYVFGPGVDEPLVLYAGTTRQFAHADERGSVTGGTLANGSHLVASNRYDEYGLYSPLPRFGRFRFTGQPFWGEVGLYYFRARWYNPRLGRFVQTDPIGYGDGMNMYAYVGGDPVNMRDPSGMDRVCTQNTSETRIRTHCVDVDGNGDGRSGDNDLSFGQSRTIANAFHGYILGNNGADLTSFQKDIRGTATEDEKTMVRVVSQFIGHLAYNNVTADGNYTAQRFLSAWNSIEYINTTREFGNREAAVYSEIGYTPTWVENRHFTINGGFGANGGGRSVYNSPSDLARIMLHEPWHVYYYITPGDPADGILHSNLDRWARDTIRIRNLGQCGAIGGFPACD